MKRFSYLIEGVSGGLVVYNRIIPYKSLAEIEFVNLVCQNNRTKEFDSIVLREGKQPYRVLQRKD